MVNEKATASKTIIEQVVAEDRSLEHPDRVSVEDKKIKESFPNKFEEINVEESAIKVDSINQDSSENDRTVIAEVRFIILPSLQPRQDLFFFTEKKLKIK